MAKYICLYSSIDIDTLQMRTKQITTAMYS